MQIDVMTCLSKGSMGTHLVTPCVVFKTVIQVLQLVVLNPMYSVDD
jgi:hypothetical protein